MSILYSWSFSVRYNQYQLKCTIIIFVYIFFEYILDKWFDSEPLKATMATDAVIGAMLSPKLSGSG